MNSTKTKYPSLFREVYWNGFSSDSEEGLQKVIENRNHFVEEFNIYNLIKTYPNSIYKHIDRVNFSYIDHPEVYFSKDGYFIIIISLYGDLNENIIKDGWVQYNNLYSVYKSTTYYKAIKKLKRVKRNQAK